MTSFAFDFCFNFATSSTYFPPSRVNIFLAKPEVIFSLDGLGLLGYEAALSRDYPVIFATLYFFSLFS